MAKLTPSILSADFANLASDVNKALEGGADYIHVDVMDGAFVPNISFGAPVLKCLSKVCEGPYDVHLMIENPDARIPDFVLPGVEYIIVHQEACKHLHRSVQLIKSLGLKAGVALNPATPVSAIEPMLADLDMVLVMSVNPGFGGQKFIGFCLDKIKELDKLRSEKGYNYIIEIDGGVTLENAGIIADAGCDLLVAGSAVFGAEDIKGRVEEFKKVLNE